MLGVPGLVEECAPVVRTALRLDDEDHALGDLDADTERARRLVRAVLEVELHVLLRMQVDAEVGKRRLERGNHSLLRERRVPREAAPDARDVPALDLSDPEADAAAEEAVARVLPEALGRVEEGAALVGEIVERILEAAVELRVVRRAEAFRLPVHDLRGTQVERVHVLFGQLIARTLEPFAPAAILRVGDRRADVAVRNVLAVDRRLEARLELSDLLLLQVDEVAEIALARELPELARVAAAVHRGADRKRGLELRQIGVTLIDRHQVVGVLEA